MSRRDELITLPLPFRHAREIHVRSGRQSRYTIAARITTDEPGRIGLIVPVGVPAIHDEGWSVDSVGGGLRWGPTDRCAVS